METDELFGMADTPQDMVDAAVRLYAAYRLLRGQHVHACSLEAELDEAVAGQPLYTDEEKLG